MTCLGFFDWLHAICIQNLLPIHSSLLYMQSTAVPEGATQLQSSDMKVFFIFLILSWLWLFSFALRFIMTFQTADIANWKHFYVFYSSRAL